MSDELDLKLLLTAAVLANKEGLLKMCRRLLQNTTIEAEDCLQDMLVKLIKRAETMSLPPNDLRGYVYRSSRNACFSALKRHKKRNEQQIEDSRWETVGGQTDAQSDTPLSLANLMDRCGLTECERVVVDLIRGGFEVEQIANELQVSQGTVRFHKHNAIMKLKGGANETVDVPKP